MAFTVEELKGWVGTLGVSADDEKVLLNSLGSKPEVLAKVGDSVLAQREFTRKMNELGDERKRLEKEFKDKQAAEDSFANDLRTWKTTNEGVIRQAQEARKKAEDALAANAAEIRKLASEYSIPEDRIKPVLEAAPVVNNNNNRQDPPRDIDTGKFVTREDFDKTGRDYLRAATILDIIADEHRELFGAQGARLDRLTLLENAEKNKRSLRQEWEAEYKVQERRDAIAKETHDREIADAEKRGEERWRTKMAAEHPEMLNNVRSIDQHQGSPILERARAQAAEREKQNNNKPPEFVDPNRGLNAALAAWNQGKYQQGERKPA